MATPNERPKLREFYNELLNFHCRFGGMNDNDPNWDDCMNAANELANQNGNSDFVCMMLATVIEQIEREAKRK